MEVEAGVGLVDGDGDGGRAQRENALRFRSGFFSFSFELFLLALLRAGLQEHLGRPDDDGGPREPPAHPGPQGLPFVQDAADQQAAGAREGKHVGFGARGPVVFCVFCFCF